MCRKRALVCSSMKRQIEKNSRKGGDRLCAHTAPQTLHRLVDADVGIKIHHPKTCKRDEDETSPLQVLLDDVEGVFPCLLFLFSAVHQHPSSVQVGRSPIPITLHSACHGKGTDSMPCTCSALPTQKSLQGLLRLVLERSERGPDLVLQLVSPFSADGLFDHVPMQRGCNSWPSFWWPLICLSHRRYLVPTPSPLDPVI